MNPFIVFDFETDGVDPYVCQPVQLACLTIDPNSLQIIESSKFCSDMKPEGIDDIDEYLGNTKRMDTIKWHSKIQKCSVEDVIERWRNATPQSTVWKNFVQHVNKYNSKGRTTTAPVACGMNIKNFDLPIANRLNSKYKVNKLFNYKSIDLMDIFYQTLVWDSEIKSFSMDNMRKYFGMEDTGAHDALVDVEDTAQFIIRYLQFFKNTFNRQPNPYKGCMRPKELLQNV